MPIYVDDTTHDDCPVFDKIRLAIGQQGLCDTLVWQMRDRKGEVLDLSAYFDTESPEEEHGQVTFRFSEVTGTDGIVEQLIGAVVDAEQGLVQCDLTAAIVDFPGVYNFSVGISEYLAPNQYSRRLIDNGLLSVERSLFGDLSQHSHIYGPPTLQEIRLELRDTAIENELYERVEFSDVELVHAIAKPLHYWNSVPPPVGMVTSRSFPYRDHWLRAIVSQLLKTAAIASERNDLGASHGGINMSELNKFGKWLQLSAKLQKEWEDFVFERKVTINAQSCRFTL